MSLLGTIEWEATDVLPVKLADFGANKTQVIKVVCKLTGCSLKQAKDLGAGAPKLLMNAVPKAEAEAARVKLEAVGARVEVT